MTMKKDDCLSLNQQIIDSIGKFDYKKEDHEYVKNIVFEIINLKNVENILGTFGTNLKNFLLHADLNHAEFLSFLRYKIFSDECIEEVRELLALNKYCKRKKMHSMVENLHKLCKYFVTEKMFLLGKTIDNLSKTKVHSRFLPDRQRWDVRSCKKPTKIQGYKKLVDVDESSFDKVFACYHHNSTTVNNILTDLRYKANVFKNIDCRNLSSELDSAISRIENDLQSQSLGFHRITLNAVARNVCRFYSGYTEDDDIKIFPVDLSWYNTNSNLSSLISICEKFPAYDNQFACFDHYGVIKSENAPFGIVVGERDTQTFFIGYYHE